MEKQMKWGFATLMLLLGIAAVFIFLDQNAELQQLEKETAESDKLRQEHNKPQETPGAVEELPPVVRPNEHPSGPHRPEDDTAHNPSVSQTYTGPLTYHAELLKTNPVKALRLQAEERGHVNAKWIPPFPPDDQEAQAFARNIYLSIYLDEDDPAYEKAAMAEREQLRAINSKYPYGARLMDLSKLIWVLSSRTLSHYNRGGTAKSPSDYFPLHISDLK